MFFTGARMPDRRPATKALVAPKTPDQVRKAIASLDEERAAATIGGTIRGSSLQWLADAPSFIDAAQIASFYDAVVRPPHQVGPTTLEWNAERAVQVGAKLGLDVNVKPNAVLDALTSLIPFVKADLKLSGAGTGDISRKSSGKQIVEIRPITTPQRQLEQLVLHYLLNHPDRLSEVSKLDRNSLRDSQFATGTPRAVVLVDIAPGTKIIPTAAEMSDGSVKLIFEALKDGDKDPPPYPESPKVPADKLPSARLEYWKGFGDRFNVNATVRAIEAAASSGNGIRWIDYRVLADADGSSIHLHLSPGGKYDVGTFAYNFVGRGFRHGLRIVGTLKSEPDINVLAVYEK